MKQEIFAAGKWNGFPFSVNDLKKMASSFSALKDYLKVPLKMGHNDEQQMTDGQPALGWVTDMFVNEESTPPKLIAEFTDMPSIVEQAVTKKLYRNVSIELDFDVTHKDKKYDFVVTAVALLGADLPAVNVLNDLGAFLASRDSMPQGDYSAGRHTTFSTINGNMGDPTMPKTIEELTAELAEAKAELANQKATFSTQLTEAQSKAAEAAKQLEASAAAQKAQEVTAARAKFTAILEDAVKAKAITPAQRESYSAVLNLDDDDAVLALKEDTVKALFANIDPKEGNFGRSGGDGDDITDNVAESLTDKTHKFMADTGEKDFQRALFTTMRANPDLAADYITSNGEVQ